MTNRLKPGRGVSVYDRPDHPNLTAFGGAYLLGALPDGLRVIRVGHDPSHHEVVPDTARSLTFEEFQRLLDRIVLTPVESPEEGV